MNDANEAMISMSVGDSLDAELQAKADKTEVARLDAALAGKEAAGTVEAHNDSASAHPDIRNELEKKLEASDLSCHNTNATAHADIRGLFSGKEDAGTAANKVLAHNDSTVAHTDIRGRLDGKVDKVSGMGLSSNDFTAEEKADVAMNTGMRHSHENKAVLDGITAAQTDDWCNATMHMTDPVKHVTAAERSSWNGKADKTYVDSSLTGKANAAQLCNPNLLVNSYFGTGVINQRGQSSYGTGEYAIDMWKLDGATYTVDTQTLATSEIIGHMYQFIENSIVLAGKEVTFSVQLKSPPQNEGYVQLWQNTNGGAAQNLGGALKITPGGDTFYSITRTLPTGMTSYNLRAVISTLTGSLSVQTAKLEMGGVSTLANEPLLNSAMDLAKCQRYQIYYAGDTSISITQYSSTSLWGTIFTPVEQRITPAISSGSIRVYGVGADINTEIPGFTLGQIFRKGNVLVFRMDKASHGYNGSNMTLRMNNALIDANLKG